MQGIKNGETCRECRFFNNDPVWLETTFRGLNSLSSAYGCSRGESGICSHLDIFMAPASACRFFERFRQAMVD